MKKLLDPSEWDHPIMFLIFMVLALIPTAFVLTKVFSALGWAPAAQLTGSAFGA